MALQLKAVQKPFRKFRKLLKGFSKPPAPKEVHSLRTQSRRLQAVVHALNLGDTTGAGDLLKELKPIRKQAGEVRDMDVLIGFASALEHDAGDESVVELLERLAARRKKAAQKLSKTIAARKQKAGNHLKRCFKLVEDETGSQNGNTRGAGEVSTKPMALALQLQSELAEWPAFNSKNIHPYRLKVKELRYVLELGEGSESQFSAALGEVKDQIGAWHDWNQLAEIAKETLGNGNGPKLLKQIRNRVRQEFEKALDLANGLRARYFSGPAVSSPGKKGPVRDLSTTAIKETTRLAG